MAELDQYGRRLNLEIHGLQVERDPNHENVQEVVQKFSMRIGGAFDPSDIHETHRLQPWRDGKPPSLIVQLFSRTIRDKWLHNGRKARLDQVSLMKAYALIIGVYLERLR